MFNNLLNIMYCGNAPLVENMYIIYMHLMQQWVDWQILFQNYLRNYNAQLYIVCPSGIDKPISSI